MKTFPMFLRMEGREVLIVGGGEQAAQKARLILKTEARLTLVAGDLDDELAALVEAGRAAHETRPPAAERLGQAAIVFAASGCPCLDACTAALSREGGALVNAVDQPELCDAVTPSIVDRDPVVVAIGTEGTAPVLARQIKTQIETMLEPTLGGFAALAGRLRGAVAASVPRARRRAFWRWAFDQPRRTHAGGAEREAARVLKAAISAGGAPDAPDTGSISLVGAGPGAADLLTLRAVRRLQEADIIFYDRLVDPQMLELARRDAERVFVGKAPGAHAWPQERIDGVIVAEARQGKRVVRLKGGDPSIFGRADEELSGAASAGIPTEIVPGITAASAAAASLGRALTERGHTNRLVLATARSAVTGSVADLSDAVAPGTTLAIYMGLGAARDLQRQLIDSGLSPDLEADVVSSASLAGERCVSTRLGRLAEDIEENALSAPSMILLRRPAAAAVAPGCDTPMAPAAGRASAAARLVSNGALR
ncbi:MAG: siroheme synthase CysG [Pseudomonadota bacterium]